MSPFSHWLDPFDIITRRQSSFFRTCGCQARVPFRTFGRTSALGAFISGLTLHFTSLLGLGSNSRRWAGWSRDIYKRLGALYPASIRIIPLGVLYREFLEFFLTLGKRSSSVRCRCPPLQRRSIRDNPFGGPGQRNTSHRCSPSSCCFRLALLPLSLRFSCGTFCNNLLM
ncbi:hypothetical protein RSAG8_00852, partial [Rhizoctonia solani AG-8 WAC10335]